MPAVLLAACSGTGRWATADPIAEIGGVRVEVLSATVNDSVLPWRRPAAGTHCVVYTVRVQAVDGRTHDLRPDAFAAGGGTAVDALGHCNTSQMEPTNVRSTPHDLQLTILERTPDPQPLQVRR